MRKLLSVVCAADRLHFDRCLHYLSSTTTYLFQIFLHKWISTNISTKEFMTLSVVRERKCFDGLSKRFSNMKKCHSLKHNSSQIMIIIPFDKRYLVWVRFVGFRNNRTFTLPNRWFASISWWEKKWSGFHSKLVFINSVQSYSLNIKCHWYVYYMWIMVEEIWPSTADYRITHF